MNLDIELAAKPAQTSPSYQPQNYTLLTIFSDHPLKTWIENNPGATKLQVAESSYDLSRYQVYNWLAAAIERGEIICIEGMYYSPLHGQ